MASVLFVNVMCFLKMLCFCLGSAAINTPAFSSVRVINITSSGLIQLEASGSKLDRVLKVMATANKSSCSAASFSMNEHISVNYSNSTYMLMTFIQRKDLPENLFLCALSDSRTRPWLGEQMRSEVNPRTLNQVPSDDSWIHQGESVVFRTKFSDPSATPLISSAEGRRSRREDPDWTVHSNRKDALAADEDPGAPAKPKVVQVFGFKLESADKFLEPDERGVPEVLVGSKGTLRLFGLGWTDSTRFMLTEHASKHGDVCEYPLANGEQKLVMPNDPAATSAVLELAMPDSERADVIFYLCTKEGEGGQWVHIGDDDFLQIKSYKKLLPFWLQLTIIVVCLGFSSLFSGLNLGLMSLDRTDLKIICNTGSELEREHAKVIIPVREHGNYLLCSILLGNVMVNSTFTILLDDLTSGLVAIIVSTLLIVVCGEITPQAVCSRHGLAIGAKTIGITKVVMVLTFPLAYPISKILDWALGEEIGAVYTRERLKELVKLTTEFNDLEKEEVNIISGALELRKKLVADVMTRLEDVFMLSYDTILDFETVSEIMKSGFSRIPVFEDTKQNIVTVLYIKDLALVDPDDNTPLKTLCQFYQNSCYFVFEDTTLDVLFKQFKEGIKGHMAFVHRVNNEGEGDPFYETVGLITLEDVIEELIQAEIMDETDVWTDNRSKNRRSQNRSIKKDFTSFAERSENQRIHISPQLTLATFQFLSTSVDAFKPDNISETILSRLLKQDIIYHIKIKTREKIKADPHTIIYKQGKAADYFVLILEGRVEVTMGRENLVFESGPFTYFGMQALTQNIGVGEIKLESPTIQAQPLGSLQSVNLESMLRYTFVPDYSVRAVCDTFYLRIKRSFYLAAKRATLMERSTKEETNAGDNFDDEVEKLLHTYDYDSRSQGSPDITRTQSQRGTPSQTSPNSALNNGSVLHTSSEPTLVSPPHTPRADNRALDERATLLPSADT